MDLIEELLAVHWLVMVASVPETDAYFLLRCKFAWTYFISQVYY